MTKSVLSDKQKLFLSFFSENKDLRSSFYLTGGTALCGFYIPYRYSEDLDFFSESEFEISGILPFIKKTKKLLGYGKIDINRSFNRNIIQLIYPKEILKLEFTYFPFPQVEKPKYYKGVAVDSVTDIATNKLFTIYQKPRSRDYMDLYMISKKHGFEMEDLIKKARVKFDWHVDPIVLGTQFLLAKSVKDYPKLLSDLDHSKWQDFFTEEAKKLKEVIIK